MTMLSLQEAYAVGPHCIRTWTGQLLDLSNPHFSDIRIEDIARGLSYKFRFGAHSASTLTVAEHSINASKIVPEEHALAALLHDASEAYIGDIPSPIKSLMPDYKQIEHKLTLAIFKRFNVPYPLHDSVKKADQQLLEAEWEFVVHRGQVQTMIPAVAHMRFLNRFTQLTGKE